MCLDVMAKGKESGWDFFAALVHRVYLPWGPRIQHLGQSSGSKRPHLVLKNRLEQNEVIMQHLPDFFLWRHLSTPGGQSGRFLVHSHALQRHPVSSCWWEKLGGCRGFGLVLFSAFEGTGSRSTTSRSSCSGVWVQGEGLCQIPWSIYISPWPSRVAGLH